MTSQRKDRKVEELYAIAKRVSQKAAEVLGPVVASALAKARTPEEARQVLAKVVGAIDQAFTQTFGELPAEAQEEIRKATEQTNMKLLGKLFPGYFQ